MAKRKAKDTDPAVTSTRRSSRLRTSNEGDLAAAKKTITPNRDKVDKKPQNTSNHNAAKTKKVKREDPQPSKLFTSPEANSKLVKGDVPATQRFWLMKAEPESRLERGHDIKFSIDDLAAKTEPEPWDGIRAYPARNNLRAMKKGDLAFFYHSSCKVPAIVGLMEIVKEHSPDLTAQDPKAAYYDPKDVDASNPKWSVVHVEFRRKLKEPITLQELREFSAKGGALENMQILRQSRLSVSAVAQTEWRFLMDLIEDREG